MPTFITRDQARALFLNEALALLYARDGLAASVFQDMLGVDSRRFLEPDYPPRVQNAFLEALKQHLALPARRVDASGLPDDVRLDGVPVAPGLELRPGRHVLQVRPPAAAVRTALITLTAGEAEGAVTLEPLAGFDRPAGRVVLEALARALTDRQLDPVQIGALDAAMEARGSGSLAFAVRIDGAIALRVYQPGGPVADRPVAVRKGVAAPGNGNGEGGASVSEMSNSGAPQSGAPQSGATQSGVPQSGVSKSGVSGAGIGEPSTSGMVGPAEGPLLKDGTRRRPGIGLEFGIDALQVAGGDEGGFVYDRTIGYQIRLEFVPGPLLFGLRAALALHAPGRLKPSDDCGGFPGGRAPTDEEINAAAACIPTRVGWSAGLGVGRQVRLGGHFRFVPQLFAEAMALPPFLTGSDSADPSRITVLSTVAAGPLVRLRLEASPDRDDRGVHFGLELTGGVMVTSTDAGLITAVPAGIAAGLGFTF